MSNEQLLDWVRHPVPNSQLGNVASLKCNTPQVDASERICNGIPQNEDGLLSHCPFNDFPFYTCVSNHDICSRKAETSTYLEHSLSMDVRRSNQPRQCLIHRNKFPTAKVHVTDVSVCYTIVIIVFLTYISQCLRTVRLLSGTRL